MKLIENSLWPGLSLKLNYYPHSLTVTFIPQIRNTFNLFFFDQISYFFNHYSFVYLIWELRDDDGRLYVFHLFNICYRPHQNGTFTCGIDLSNLLNVVNLGFCGKIRSLDML